MMRLNKSCKTAGSRSDCEEHPKASTTHSIPLMADAGTTPGAFRIPDRIWRCAGWACHIRCRIWLRHREFRPPRAPKPNSAANVASPSRAARSEEHTSELQSPDHLVCRLLLEK